MARQTEFMDRDIRMDEGWYACTVEKTEKFKTASGKGNYRIWTFYLYETSQSIRLLLFPYESKELILTLGGTEDGKGYVSWDDEEVLGKQCQIHLFYQKDKDGKDRLKIKEVKGIEETTSEDFTSLEEKIELDDKEFFGEEDKG